MAGFDIRLAKAFGSCIICWAACIKAGLFNISAKFGIPPAPPAPPAPPEPPNILAKLDKSGRPPAPLAGVDCSADDASVASNSFEVFNCSSTLFLAVS
ncbi:hypothetical protein WICMUC_003826 [Wickerhamomyces mucosus]|uniref:Uncharacterized protein n=1 Tax=Wickerhamomyces mucosus TaxID=1378264 RepID=A0A9P8PJ93_9ASCO|nr:hypothetical protein WICMUC_003826 [Wickerhamomyces mucosus]